ncbi:STAS domain-containing protein [Streptomyces sp. NPDC090306]|uniref:STAS domain-containing protein n=1 Tax=unclassified Streptomyces TaxID=2593676 RepID=UPI0036E4BF58
MAAIHLPDSTEEFSITCLDADGVDVVAVVGEIDGDTAEQVRSALPHPPGPAAARTVVDFSRTTFMDSSGVNVLIRAHGSVPDGGWLRIAGATGAVLRVVELVGLDQMIDCYPTVREAISASA